MKMHPLREPEPFEPKLVAVLREGYRFEQLRHDFFAAITVAIVALPLSMAIAIASGVGPERGLYAAIIGGFLISALGGSRFQIGGPAGAFIVLVSTTVALHGVDGMLLATAMAGVLMAVAGLLRVGTYVRLIPHPVVVGFTAGIAVTILASQLHDLFGLDLPHEPAAFLPKLAALWHVAGTASIAAIGIAALSIATILLLKRQAPQVPGLLIAVAGTAILAWAAAPASRNHRFALRQCAAHPAGARPAAGLVAALGGAAAHGAFLRAARRHREPAVRSGRRWHDRDGGIAPTANCSRRASPMSAPRCSAGCA